MTTTPHAPSTSGAVDPDHVARAVAAADRAAREARTLVREVTDLSELEAIVRLYGTVWGRRGNPPLTMELLRAFSKAGNYVAGAFDGVQLVGACVGFFHGPDTRALHSHITGVSPLASGRSIGFALKQHQRAWALERGVGDIYWTFDPLVSRNAHFNLAKLGAEPVEYLPNFYGPMSDAINRFDDSDRLLMRWRLTAPAVVAAGDGVADTSVARHVPSGAAVALGVSATGAPVQGTLTADTSIVAVPPDIELLRVRDAVLAGLWRAAVREVLTELMGNGARVTGFDRAGHYVVRRSA